MFLVILSVGAMGMPHDDRHTAAMITHSCESLSPAGDAHGTTIQTTTSSPYTVTVSANKVKAGGKLTVTITGDADNSFKGFMVQARDDQNHKIGTFVSTDDNAQTLTCDKTDVSTLHCFTSTVVECNLFCHVSLFATRNVLNLLFSLGHDHPKIDSKREANS